MFASHCYTQQQENVWMAETFPRHYFPAEPLRNRNQQFDIQYLKVEGMTYAHNFVKVAGQVYSQNFDRNLAILIFAHLHISIPAVVQGII